MRLPWCLFLLEMDRATEHSRVGAKGGRQELRWQKEVRLA